MGRNFCIVISFHTLGHLYIYAPIDPLVEKVLTEAGFKNDPFLFSKHPQEGLSFLTRLMSYESCEEKEVIKTLSGSDLSCKGICTLWS